MQMQMTIVRSRVNWFHEVNREIIAAGVTAGVLGLALTLTGVSSQAGAGLGYVGIMAAFNAAWNLICERSCGTE